MVDRLRVTELDFDQIKNNLKSFLRQQTQFQDYDFEGAGLNVMVDLLAYNTHYNAYYLNMVANEAFMDTAILRDSVVSHAKTLGYTPFSASAAMATINITVRTATTNPTDPQTLTIPKGFVFISNMVDGTAYEFVTLQPYTVAKNGENFYFENIEIYQGKLISYSYTQDNLNNPKALFTLPDDNVDSSTLTVSVRASSSNTNSTVYQQVTDVLDVTSTSEVYFLQEDRKSRYQIYFGDNILGKKLPDGAVVTATYLVTKGAVANKSATFVAADNFRAGAINYPSYLIVTTNVASGGKSRQTTDEIKKAAMSQFATQNRLVTYKDYETYILGNYPNIDAISVWGGEDEVPKLYGQIFVSMKPKANYYITETEKQRIIDEIITPKAIVSTTCTIKDPEYLYLLVNIKARYDKRKTLSDIPTLKLAIRNSLINYRNQNMDTFSGEFLSSEAQQAAKTSDASITGTEVVVRLQKRFKPQLSASKTYTLNYGVQLHRGTLTNKLSSTDFTVYDSLGVLRTAKIEEVPQSYTGLTSIEVTNAGYGYTEQPTVTITGDGTGAEAIAVISNGKVQSIVVTNRGSEYTRAIATISGGGGSGAAGIPVLDAKHGTLRTIYFDTYAQRQIINEKAGTINYETGIVTIDNLRIISVNSTDGYVRVDVESDNSIVSTTKNTILTIDSNDSAAITVEMIEV